MTTSAATTPLPDTYGEEMHFGVVMYGGVSLAVYINGVSHELFEMACATPTDGNDLGGMPPVGTRAIYRQLSYLAGQRQRVAAFAERLRQDCETPWSEAFEGASEAGFERMRFVVDVIAGTSAGGINGLFLAKALVNAERFDELGELWVNEADIGRLLNDKDAYADLPIGTARRDDPPASLLSGDRMYLKLLDALRNMAPLLASAKASAHAKSKLPPLVEALDLYLTTTDIVGSPVPLRLYDQIVYEKRHKQRFHFSYPSAVAKGEGQEASDFAPAQTPLLAFAARCTSSFPFAFEPMTLQRTAELPASVDLARMQSWRPYFDGLPPLAMANDGYMRRPFGDGGYLDNKPFSYAVQALTERFGDVPVQRKLLYVEPDPESVDLANIDRPGTPDAVSNAMSALITIPGYETIREDLQTVLARNQRIERVEWLATQVEKALERSAPRFSHVKLQDDGTVKPWSQLPMATMVEFHGESFLAYSRLRVYTTTDWLAMQVGAAWGLQGTGDAAMALLFMVRAWRDQRFADDPSDALPVARQPAKQQPVKHQTQNMFLMRYDLDYRLRRLTFLLRRVDLITRLFRQDAAQGLAADLSDLQVSVRKRMLHLWALTPHSDLWGVDPMAHADSAQAALFILRGLKVRLRDIYRRALALRRAARAGQRVKAQGGELGADEATVHALLGALLGNASGNEGTTLHLERVGAQSLQLEINEPWLQTTSATHTLRESVVARVKKLVDADEPGQRLKVWAWLEKAIAACVVDVDEPTLPAGDNNFAQLWRELAQCFGNPRLAPDSGGAKLVVDAVGTCAPEQRSVHDTMAGFLHGVLGEYFLRFDAFDQPRFTLYFDTNTGEPATVDVLRVSPLDATALFKANQASQKVAGTALGHFGAFLDQRWRRNDLMWGRLDGAERLITAVLPGQDDDTQIVRKALTQEAHNHILRETLLAKTRTELTRKLLGAVAELRGPLTAEQASAAVLAALNIAPGPARISLQTTLQDLLKDADLRGAVGQVPTYPKQLLPEPTLKAASRAVTIVGRMLEAVSEGKSQAQTGGERGGGAPYKSAPVANVARWMSRLGLVIHGVLVLATPGSLQRRWWRHASIMLFGLEAALLALAFVFGSDGLRTAATTALILTAALQLLVWVLGDWMQERERWPRIVAVSTVVALTALAGLGVAGLVRLGPVTMLLTEPIKAPTLWQWLLEHSPLGTDTKPTTGPHV